MAGPTNIPVGDARAVKRWSATLFLDMLNKAYWDKRFTSKKPDSPIQRLTELDSEAGDTISFDVSVQLRGTPTTGDNRVEGKAENLRFFTDEVKIDQMRKTVSSGGKMTRKRTLHNLRDIAKERLTDYWAKYLDELTFIYLSGARGVNEDFFEPVTYAGHAGNAINAPDTSHILYGGDATGKGDLETADKMTKALIEKCQTHASMMRAVDPTTANMMPVMIEGEAHYVLLMGKYDEYNLRQETGSNGWLEIAKAAAAAEGRKSPIFKGGLGMIGRTVLHSHESTIRFSDYGSGGNIAASRALFMGRQAAVVAYGTKKGTRASWSEEQKDHGNEIEVCAGYINGLKKTRFNSKDFGIIAVDVASAAP